MHTSTALNTGGFQYTNNVLDFFPPTSTALSTGLGNIRLKYAQDPSNNNRISILEEDHYYPYGLKHSGYNSFHQIFATDDGDVPGTGIVLTPVNPFLGPFDFRRTVVIKSGPRRRYI